MHADESMRGRGRLAAVSSDDGTSSCERWWDSVEEVDGGIVWKRWMVG